MEDTKILKEMIKKTALVTLEGPKAKPRVILKEPDAPDSSATISQLPSDALVIKIDAFRSLEKIFNGDKGECKRADFVIISENKKVIIYIEMKRGKKEKNHILRQLMGAQCFVRYCREIGKEFWHEKNFLRNYKHRYVSMGHTKNIDKRKTRIQKNSGSHDSPENAMKIDWPKDTQYNILAGP